MPIIFSQIFDMKNKKNHKYSNIHENTLFLNITSNEKKDIFNHKGLKYLYYDNILDEDIDIIYDCDMDLTKLIFLVENEYCKQILQGLFSISSIYVDIDSMITKNIQKIENIKKVENIQKVEDIQKVENKKITSSVSYDNLDKNNEKEIVKSLSSPNFNTVNSTNDIKFTILTNKKLESVANNLSNYFSNMNINSDIVYEINKVEQDKNEIYIILYVKYFTEQNNILPEKYIIYQMEQVRSNMFTKEYYKILSYAYKILDFSSANDFYYSKINRKDILINNFPLTCEVCTHNTEYDILFYGELNLRRLTILKLLQKKFNIVIRNDIFGKERDNYIKRCKIVINLHYYHDACLETCRINEVLKFNKLVISEEPKEADKFNRNLYKNSIQLVELIKSDMSNIDKINEKISFCLQNYESLINKNDIKTIEEFSKKQFSENIDIIYGDLQNRK